MGFSYLLSMGACSVLFFPQKAYIYIYMPQLKSNHTQMFHYPLCIDLEISLCLLSKDSHFTDDFLHCTQLL